MAMRNPIPKPVTNQGATTSGKGGGQGSGGQGKKKRPNYCWAFNKGGVCKDPKCKFVNRCSYCDSPDHPCLLVQRKPTIKFVMHIYDIYQLYCFL